MSARTAAGRRDMMASSEGRQPSGPAADFSARLQAEITSSAVIGGKSIGSDFGRRWWCCHM
eukprot:9000534-Alexandrium_andersonii.AAC.1